MKIISILILAICLIAICRCEKERSVISNSSQLLKTDQEFAKLSVDSGAAYAFHKYIKDDAIMLPANRYPIFGLDSIYASMSKNDSKYILSWEPQKAEVAKSGELGWTWGNYTMSDKNEQGIPEKSNGKYLNIWKLESDGSWKVYVDMGNKNPDK